MVQRINSYDSSILSLYYDTLSKFWPIILFLIILAEKFAKTHYHHRTQNIKTTQVKWPYALYQLVPSQLTSPIGSVASSSNLITIPIGFLFSRRVLRGSRGCLFSIGKLRSEWLVYIQLTVDRLLTQKCLEIVITGWGTWHCFAISLSLFYLQLKTFR